MRTWFRTIGWAEGVSLITLFFVAMPLKYVWGDPSWVRVVGAAHGGLFVVYAVLAFILFDRENWTNRTLALALVLSSVPFGTLIFERKFMPSLKA